MQFEGRFFFRRSSGQTGLFFCILATMLAKTSGENFCAIDFETGSYPRASACAVALVRVRDGEIADSFYSLIKPPEEMGILRSFTAIHGIYHEGRCGLADVRGALAFNARVHRYGFSRCAQRAVRPAASWGRALRITESIFRFPASNARSSHRGGHGPNSGTISLTQYRIISVLNSSTIKL